MKQGDIYQHYKGGKYRFLYVGLYEETKQKVVVYQGLEDNPPYPKGQIWIRDEEKFFGDVKIDGSVVKRFQLLDS